MERLPKKIAGEDELGGEHLGEAKRQIAEGSDALSPAQRLALIQQAQSDIHAEIAAKKEEVAHVDAKIERTRELLAPSDVTALELRIGRLNVERQNLLIAIEELEHRLEHLGGIRLNIPPKPTLN